MEPITVLTAERGEKRERKGHSEYEIIRPR
jgi:hypothetical protein